MFSDDQTRKRSHPYERISQNKPSIGHPERTKYAKFCAGEESHKVAPNGAKPRSDTDGGATTGARRRDLRTITVGFLWGGYFPCVQKVTV